MHTMKLVMNIVIRATLTAVVLANALVPTAALARPEVRDADSSEEAPAANNQSYHPSAFYEPSMSMESSLRTSSDKDDPEPKRPSKDPVEFSVFTSREKIGDNRTITVHVAVRNRSGGGINNIGYYDKLNTRVEYGSSPDPAVKFSSATGTVTYMATGLGDGEELNFSYSLRVNNIPGKLGIHNAELEYELNGEMIAQTTSFGHAAADSLVEHDSLVIVPDQAGDGWASAGRYSLYLGGEVIPRDVMASITPAEYRENGPALQFDIELIQTAVPAATSDGVLREQEINLIEVVETQFTTPAYLEINLDGYLDLENVPAGQEAYVATFDDTLGVWVKVPIVETDPAFNTVTVAAAHFSTWGVGLGSSLPQNGANVLLFDQPYTSLFTGASRYSIPIWAPPGRAGMAPSVSLSYSSGTVNGVLGDVQAPWTGVGWNIDAIEIVRKITTNSNGYGYVNEFALTLNGAVYTLVQDTVHPSRYYTDHDAFLYIEQHNYANGNAERNGSFPLNDSGEWWEVVTTDGTRYRLGWNKDSEQLALMYGYKCTSNGSSCLTPDGAYASLGYAGLARDLVALRWRVDLIRDTHGNTIQYQYAETQPSGSTTIAAFDRESYLETISYTGFEDPDHPESSLPPAYHIRFVYADRNAVGDVPTTFNIWDNVDSKLLDKILVCYQSCAAPGTIVRTYDLEYSLAAAPNANGTLTLASLKVTGGGFTEAGQPIPVVEAPTIRFTYQNMDNRAVTGSDDKYSYPRLVSIDNGAGGLLSYTYETDGRGTNSWYNYRVKEVRVKSSTVTAALQSYAYATPVYTGAGGNPDLGELIGYTTVTENQLDYSNSNSVILSTAHTFGTKGLDIGRELKTEWSSGGTVHRRVTNVYVTDNSQAPFDRWNFRYLYSTLNYERSNGNLALTTKSLYKRDAANGNLLYNIQYLGPSVYRKTYYEYLTDPDPSVYILDKVSRVILTDASNGILNDTRHHYDGLFNEPPTVGDLTLTRRLTGSGSQTVDTAAGYDIYGNVTSTEIFKDYGMVDEPPSGASYTAVMEFDQALQTYPIKTVDPLGSESSTSYIFALGLPYQGIDPNGWTTTTAYDGLGRTLSTFAPGLDQPGVYYTYPQVINGRITAPYSVEMQILDTLANKYRSVWGFYDGLGRMIQTQVYDEDQQKTLVSDSFFNPQGLIARQSLPYYSNSGGGYYLSPSGSQFTESAYDALGRVTSLTQPGGITTSSSYNGLTVTILDPDNRKISRTTDGLGRLINVKEYSDSATVYAATIYTYDIGDRLIGVLDGKGNATTITYDWLGRKTGMDDPDMGVWLYEYNALGGLTRQQDARGAVLNFTYDPLGRLLTKSGDGVNTSYAYGTQPGTIGMRTGMADASGTTTWTYSNYGRSVTENRQIGGAAQSMTTSTDWLGRPISVVYPDDELITYAYDALGRPNGLDSSVHASLVDAAYNVLGQIASQTYGNGTLVENSYNAANRLETRSAAANNIGILNFTYSYDSAGNITQIADGMLNETHVYDYDFLNRLTHAEAYSTGDPQDYKYRQQFMYDQVGNMLRMSDWAIPVPQAYREPEPFVDTLLSFNSSNPNSRLALPVQQGNDTETPMPSPTPGGFLFGDGFESGDFSAWDWADTDGDDLSVSTQAAFQGTFGMQAFINDTTGLKVYDNSPNAETHFSARFYLDPNSVDIPNNTQLEIFDAVQYTFCMYLGKTSGEYTLTICGKRDDGSWFEGSPVSIQNEWQAVEIEWKAASFAGADDGYLKLYVNDALVSQVVNLDTDTKTINNISFGVQDIPAGASGTLYFDAFESRKGDHIGLVPSITPTATQTNTVPPTDTPTATLPPTATLVPTNTGAPSATYTPTITPTNTATPWQGVDTYTTRLLHMDGPDGSTSFTDATGKVWTARGNAQLDDVFPKFGTACGLFGGSGDWIDTPDSNDFYFPGDFTVDAWVKLNALPAIDSSFWIYSQTSYESLILYRATSTTFYWQFRTGTGLVQVSTTAPPLNTWMHLAVVMSGNTGRIFKDGVQIVSGTNSTTRNNRTEIFKIGGPFNGCIDEFRISKGVARWNSNFTPPGVAYGQPTLTPTNTPTPTSSSTATSTPLADQSLKSHWNFDGASGTTVPDVGSGGTVNNSASLVNGAVVESNSGVNPGGKSIYFNGANHYATVADQAEIKNSGSFTVSAWVNPASVVTSRTQYIVKKGDMSQGYGLITLSNQGTATPTPTGSPVISANGGIAFQAGGLTPNLLNGPILPVNAWTMVTGVYDAAAKEMRLYLNGELAAAQSVTGAPNMGTGALTFSSSSSTSAYHGRLDEVRFYNRALTSSEVQGIHGLFTPPTPSPSLTPTPLPGGEGSTATPLPMSEQQWGTGADGNLTVNSGGTFNLNTQTNGQNGRACADAVSYSVTQLGSTAAVLSSSPAAGCLNPGDEVLLIQLTDSSANTYNAGSYEFLRVASVTGSTVAFTTQKTKWYGNGWRSDLDIGTGSGQNRVMLMRVPNYANVTVNGTLTASVFDSYKYGVLVFRVQGNLTGSGTISANSLGFGGQMGYGAGQQGGAYTNQPGGGGGYGTNGATVWSPGGPAYGAPDLSRIFLGSGGGNFAAYMVWDEWYSGGGGRGGGIILFAGKNIGFSGIVTSSGGNGTNSNNHLGGAGAGGSVRIEGDTISLGEVSAPGASQYAAGGLGRIAVYYYNSFSGNFTPGHLQQLNANVTQTPTPTATPSTGSTNPGTNGLAAWWTMNETSGTRFDSHGVNHLTDNNTVTSAIGKQGNAASFAAANQEFLSIADNPQISGGDIDFTLVANVYLNNTTSTMIIANKADNVDAYDYRLVYIANVGFRLRVGPGTAPVTVTSDPVLPNTWYTVIAWHNSVNNTVNIQVNNGAIKTASFAGGTMDTTNPLVIGAFASGGSGLSGLIDEFALYKRVLTSAERTWLYNSGLGRTYVDVNPPASSGWQIRDYTYDANHPHAVSAVSPLPSGEGQGEGAYTYDANGNMTCRMENGEWFVQEYNSENRISSIMKLAEGTCENVVKLATKWDFAYDGDGVRVATLTTPYDGNGDPQTASWTAYFFGGAYEVRSDSTTIKYYSFAGQMVAMNECTPQGCGTGLQYFLSDHLGSVVATTDSTGTLISQQRYLPFGGVRPNVPSPDAPATDFGYTGQRNLDSGIGLMDYKARFYSPYINRFIQPDTLIPDPSNPQDYNRYSYVLNRPIVLNDPTGHCATGALVDTVLCVAAYVGLFFIINSMSDTPQSLSPEEAQGRENSFYLGVGLLLTSGSVKSLAVEALSNTYDCINGYCDPNLMLPGSTAVYSKLNTLDAPNLSLSQAQKLDQLARENNCSITICGGFAETALGIENRRIAYDLDRGQTVGPVPDWRNTGIPQGKDLDYWTPFGVKLPKPVRDGLEEIFGISPGDNYNNYPGNKFNSPPGSLTFLGNGTAIRKIAPWQKKINWE